MKIKEKMIVLFASDYGPLMRSDDCLVLVVRVTQDRSELLSLCISESFNHLLINENKQKSQNAKRNAQRRVQIWKLLIFWLIISILRSGHQRSPSVFFLGGRSLMPPSLRLDCNEKTKHNVLDALVREICPFIWIMSKVRLSFSLT